MIGFSSRWTLKLKPIKTLQIARSDRVEISLQNKNIIILKKKKIVLIKMLIIVDEVSMNKFILMILPS